MSLACEVEDLKTHLKCCGEKFVRHGVSKVMFKSHTILLFFKQKMNLPVKLLL
jgi:hypothetical protein